MCLKRWLSSIFDGQDNLIASADGLSDTFIEGIESGLRMYQTVQAVVLTDQDAAIKPVVDSIPRFEHGTVTRQSAVGTNKA